MWWNNFSILTRGLINRTIYTLSIHFNNISRINQFILILRNKFDFNNLFNYLSHIILTKYLLIFLLLHHNLLKFKLNHSQFNNKFILNHSQFNNKFIHNHRQFNNKFILNHHPKLPLALIAKKRRIMQR